MKTLVQTNFSTLMAEAQPFIDQRVEEYVSYMKSTGRPADAFDIKYYKIGITIDMVKAFARYIKQTDKVIVNEFSMARNGSISVYLNVERSGEVYSMLTEAIIAGGYNIQCAHYRYITHTCLPSRDSKDAISLLQAERNRMTKEQRILEDMKYAKQIHLRDLLEHGRLIAMTPTEVLTEHEYDKYTGYDGLNDGGKKNFNYSRLEFEIWLRAQKEKTWKSHLNYITPVKEINKTYERTMKRLNTRLNNLK